MNAISHAIEVRDLQKIFRLYTHPLDALKEAITSKNYHIKKNVLNNIDLELERGEIVGILGRNGAGKSTLLKIIAGTLEQTAGDVSVKGRLTAILELGTGFHPEYTGRENIYMGGLCLGMSRNEIDTKVESIIEFSELSDVIDQPFKTYSTGMQARLTFSTAISIDPDILIIDEALSVGDAKFQMKCFNWLHHLKKKNATILVVSHDMNTVTTLCDRVVILENGEIFAQGEPKFMTEVYHKLLFGPKTNENKILSDKEKNSKATLNDRVDLDTEENVMKSSQDSLENYPIRYGTQHAVVSDWGIFDARGQKISVIDSGEKFNIKLNIDCNSDIHDMSCGIHITDRRGTVLWGTTNLIYNQQVYQARAGEKIIVTVPGYMWLADGEYFVTLGLAHADNGTKIDFIENAIRFKVQGPHGIYTTSMVNLQSSFEINEY